MKGSKEELRRVAREEQRFALILIVTFATWAVLEWIF